MALPTIVPTGFQGDYTDFFNTKVGRDGRVSRSQGSVSIPSGTATDTIIGLFPFNAGMSFAGLPAIYTADLDSSTNVTIDIGVAYQNSSEGTDDLDAYCSAVSAQAAAFIAPDEIDWMTLVTTGNGWVTVQVNAATTLTGSITFNIPAVYDQPVL